MLDWLRGASDPYDAQDRLAARIAEASADAVATELLRAIDDPATPIDVRELACGIAASAAEEVTDPALAAELVCRLGDHAGEPADAAFAALARALVRAPDHPGLVDAVRATARRAVQPRYDARHGRDYLERAVREGRATRALLDGFERAVAHPAEPSPTDASWARVRAVSEPEELEVLVASEGVEVLAQLIVERSGELATGSPDAHRVARVAEVLRGRLPSSDLRGRLALVQAELGLADFQIAFGCLVAALADRPSDRDALALVTQGFTEAPDVVDVDTVDFLVRTHGLDAATSKRLRAAIAKGKKAAV